MKRAVVLLSGGLDSATALYWARAKGYKPTALTVHYGQRHVRELQAARALARRAGADWVPVRLSLPWLKASSLVDRKKRLPEISASRIGKGPIPSTYVPGRNTVFLSLAVSLADAAGAEAVVIGSNAQDFSGYPDCRPEFNAAFQKTARLGTRRGAEGKRLALLAPLQRLDKAGIVRLARRLKVPLELTWSCYAGGQRPCGRCDSCKLRARGFAAAGVKDPALG
ncbi:MAG: 7-cyano-7-deazaguanine synthase QueC [Elusimicrobia bacterium]|nr:7-cyano-7-deazaguanine synthase QueC [Elusimicrobiota bacterium]